MAEREIRMRNVPKTQMQQSENIAAYYGYGSVSKWAKAEFLKIIASFPDHIKNTQWENGDRVIAEPELT